MKKMKLSLLIAGIFFLVFESCDTNTDTDLFKVSGIVYQGDIPAENVKVSLDSAINRTVYTDEEGKFEIGNVSRGIHMLQTYKSSTTHKNTNFSADESVGYSISSYKVDVNDDVKLNSLRLPKPVKIDTVLQLDSRRVQIIWTATDADDFREYKVYLNTNSGIDETSGQLIHVAIGKQDTTFILENTSSNEKYFFRVYAMNEYGKLSGSNIASIETENLNLFGDGGFETDLALDYWGLTESNSTILDSEIKHSGTFSLHLTTEAKLGRQIMHQRFSNLVVGTEYTFSFWFRVKGHASECSDVIVDFGDVFQWAQKYPFCEGVEYKEEEWCYYELTFESLKEDFSFFIYFDTFSDLWLDDLTLKRKEYL
ncbi:carbohydrate binding domain-containing protein [Saccharicrinis sp. FJH54]|uniref:carbohydrate binding domain-containing protein n=1 Tax=Saccharicrinis sp. FJH54 TaxID=3344665 RepID=UPI0035D4E422